MDIPDLPPTQPSRGVDIGKTNNNELREETRKFLSTCQKYLDCRAQMNVCYHRVDELQIIAKFQMNLEQKLKNGEEYQPDYQQQSIHGHPVQTPRQLYEAARVVLPLFHEMVQNLVQESCDRCGVSIAEVDQVLPDLKSPDRAIEKAQDDYCKRLPGPGISWVHDVVRGSIHFSSAEQVAQCLHLIVQNHQNNAIVVSFKNRFAKPTLTGYRDWKICIQLDSGQGFCHVCELQIHHKAIQALDKELDSHSYYEYFRKYFAGGSESLKERLEDLRMIADSNNTEQWDESMLDRILQK